MYVRKTRSLQVLRVPRSRGLSGLGCGRPLGCAGCGGRCKKNSLGDDPSTFDTIANDITSIVKVALPPIIQNTLGPGTAAPSYIVNPATGAVTSTAGLTAAQIAQAQAAAAAAAVTPAGYVNIGGYNVPYWALGAGAVGVALLASR